MAGYAALFCLSLCTCGREGGHGARDVVVRFSATVRIRVLDAVTGLPVANAQVLAGLARRRVVDPAWRAEELQCHRRDPDYGSNNNRSAHGITDADGRVEIAHTLQFSWSENGWVVEGRPRRRGCMRGWSTRPMSPSWPDSPRKQDAGENVAFLVDFGVVKLTPR